MSVSPSLLQHLQQVTGRNLHSHRLTAIGGGDINAAYHLQTAQLSWFIKLNRRELWPMFAAEAAGLQELRLSQQISVPEVVQYGQHAHQAYLLLEYIDLRPLRGDASRVLGQQLARLHQQPRAFFGWPIDNTIGSTPQHNGRYNDWPHFWCEQRLGKQLQFAANNGHCGKLQSLGEKLMQQIPAFFSDYQPQASLLHGDLWSGNAASDKQGNPLIFDPACYYGDRETDIAMTGLFGGFGADFYAAYQAEYPLDAGYQTRKTLYNLYHILNHLNLFGGSYLAQAISMIEQLLAALK